MADRPTLIPDPQAVLPRMDVQTALQIGGIWGRVTSGQTWMASDGPRFVWSANSLFVVYSQTGKFYSQSGRGFIGEVTTYPLIEGARRAKFMAQVAEIEMKLLMGIVAGSSGVGLALVIGSEVAEFIVENREDFEKWKRQLDAVLRAREILKIHAPTLYEKVFNAVLNKLYQDVRSRVPDAVTPEIVAFGVGVVIGTAGKLMAKGRFSILAVLVVVLEQLAIRFSIGVVPGAFKLTADEYRRFAAEIIGKLRAAGVSIGDGDVKKIVEEVRRDPDAIKRAFRILQGVFGKSVQ